MWGYLLTFTAPFCMLSILTKRSHKKRFFIAAEGAVKKSQNNRYYFFHPASFFKEFVSGTYYNTK
jgi:hypothetical protein